MRELLRNPHLHLSHDPETGIVWMVRSGLAFDSIVELRSAHQPIVAALDALGREGKCLLVDTRLAPPRDDPEFEDTLRPIRGRIMRDFVRVAVLTRTVIGQLQVQRQARESSEQMGVFNLESEAIDYLRRGIDSRRIPPRQKG